MRNPALYRVLCKHFGDVSITNEGHERIVERIPGAQRESVIDRGESYNVNCPFCGDTKRRLSISYQWLSKNPLTLKRIGHLIHCYNEECKEVYTEDFRIQFLEDLHAAELGLLDDDIPLPSTTQRVSQRGCIPLPEGCVPLHELEDTHPAIQFMLQQYEGVSSIKVLGYMSRSYGVCFTGRKDPRFFHAKDRIIFPIYAGGMCVAWQGRTILPDHTPRWFLPPGFVKVFYNLDRVGPYDTAILTEGITNAIFSGPQGIAMFGKALNRSRAMELAEHTKSVMVATDPDTFVPDNRPGGGGRVFAQELIDLLREFIPDVKAIQWPEHLLEVAQEYCSGAKVKVPDAADLGLVAMRRIIDHSM